MASNKDSVDLSSVNKAQNTQTAKPNKVISLKNPLKKQKGPARDGEGKFTSGSGRLKQISFNWKRALPLVLVVAIAGGFMVFRGFASSNTGFTANQFSAGSSVRATPVKETTRSSKRNATVISLANTASSTDARAVYTNTAAPGRYRACLLGVAQRGNPRGTLSLRVGTNAIGSMNYSATNTEEYEEINCFEINHRGGSSAASNAMTATVTNTRVNTTLRVSSVILFYEGEPVSAPSPSPNPPTPAPGANPVVDGKKCSLHLHWAGGGAQADQRDGSGYWKVWPGSPDGAFWLYDGPHNNAYDPDSQADVAKYNELVDYLRRFLDARDCGPVLLIGYSNGGGFAAKLFCKGEDFGGRVWGVIVDDPVMDQGVLGCSPSRHIREVSFTHSTELTRQAAAAVTGGHCSWDPPYNSTPRPGQGTGWYCENNRTMTLSQYEDRIGHKSVHQRELHSGGGWTDNNHAAWALEANFWNNRFAR